MDLDFLIFVVFYEEAKQQNKYFLDELQSCLNKQNIECQFLD